VQQQVTQERCLTVASMNATGAAAFRILQEKAVVERHRRSKDKVFDQTETPSGAPAPVWPAAMAAPAVSRHGDGAGFAGRNAVPASLSRTRARPHPLECFIHSVHGFFGCDGSFSA